MVKVLTDKLKLYSGGNGEHYQSLKFLKLYDAFMYNLYDIRTYIIIFCRQKMHKDQYYLPRMECLPHVKRAVLST